MQVGRCGMCGAGRALWHAHMPLARCRSVHACPEASVLMDQLLPCLATYTAGVGSGMPGGGYDGERGVLGTCWPMEGKCLYCLPGPACACLHLYSVETVPYPQYTPCIHALPAQMAPTLCPTRHLARWQARPWRSTWRRCAIELSCEEAARDPPLVI